MAARGGSLVRRRIGDRVGMLAARWPAARRSSCRHCPRRLRAAAGGRRRRRARRRARAAEPASAAARGRQPMPSRPLPPIVAATPLPVAPAVPAAVAAHFPGAGADVRDAGVRARPPGDDAATTSCARSCSAWSAARDRRARQRDQGPEPRQLAGRPADRGARLHPAGAAAGAGGVGRRRERRRAGRRSSSSPASTATSRPAPRR